MAWIQAHQSLAQHRKTLVLADSLGITRLEAIGLVVSLWWWALDNTPDGNLSGLPINVLANAAGWVEIVAWWRLNRTDSPTHAERQSPADFVLAFLQAGFFDAPPCNAHQALHCVTCNTASLQNSDSIPDHWTIHDWDEYTIALRDSRAASREATRVRVAMFRLRKKQNNSSENEAKTPLHVTLDVTPGNALHVTPDRYGNAPQSRVEVEKSVTNPILSTADEKNEPCPTWLTDLHTIPVWPKSDGVDAKLLAHVAEKRYAPEHCEYVANSLIAKWPPSKNSKDPVATFRNWLVKQSQWNQQAAAAPPAVFRPTSPGANGSAPQSRTSRVDKLPDRSAYGKADGSW